MKIECLVQKGYIFFLCNYRAKRKNVDYPIEVQCTMLKRTEEMRKYDETLIWLAPFLCLPVNILVQ